MSFLTAAWKKLAMINYEVHPDILLPYLPKGTELDLWNNTCYVSAIGFLFTDTKVLGIPIPFHTTFEEVNLRFYVKRKDGNTWKRGVVFIKEIVPKSAISIVANTVYHEHYVTMPMKHSWKKEKDKLIVSYEWKNKTWQHIKIEAEHKTIPIVSGSEAEFIAEHYFGYTKYDDHTTYEYEVTHPKWDQYQVLDYTINIDFELNYGKTFGFLNDIKPKSVYLAEGSAITVEGKKKII